MASFRSTRTAIRNVHYAQAEECARVLNPHNAKLRAYVASLRQSANRFSAGVFARGRVLAALNVAENASTVGAVPSRCEQLAYGVEDAARASDLAALALYSAIVELLRAISVATTTHDATPVVDILRARHYQT